MGKSLVFFLVFHFLTIHICHNLTSCGCPTVNPNWQESVLVLTEHSNLNLYPYLCHLHSFQFISLCLFQNSRDFIPQASERGTGPDHLQALRKDHVSPCDFPRRARMSCCVTRPLLMVHLHSHTHTLAHILPASLLRLVSSICTSVYITQS